MKKSQAYFSDTHSFFDDLVTMILSIQSYVFTLHVAIKSNNPTEFRDRNLREWIEYIRPIKDPNFPLAFGRKYDDSQFIFFPMEIVANISLNSWPQELRYYINSSANNNVMENAFQFSANSKPVMKFVGSSFISYYESQLPNIKSRYSSDKNKWPEIINFARYVRNGFAHDGKFLIENQNARKASWGQWTINFDSNGKDILFSSDGLEIGDVILLMENINLKLK